MRRPHFVTASVIGTQVTHGFHILSHLEALGGKLEREKEKEKINKSKFKKHKIGHQSSLSEMQVDFIPLSRDPELSTTARAIFVVTYSDHKGSDARHVPKFQLSVLIFTTRMQASLKDSVVLRRLAKRAHA